MHADEGDEKIVEAQRVLRNGKTDGPSNAARMEAALRETPRQAAESLRKDGPPSIIMSHVSDSGTTTKEVSPEDFIAGKF